MTKEEFENLVITHGKAVYSFCLHLTKQKDEADDLYQDSFLIAMEKRENLELSGNPKSFILGITIRLWKSRVRKNIRRQELAPVEYLGSEPADNQMPACGMTPEEAVLADETRRLIQKAASSLPPKQQVVLYLYYTAELTVEEIARTLKVPAGTVKSRLSQARKGMKTILEVQGYGR